MRIPLALTCAALVALAGSVSAAPSGPYGEVLNILPPGSSGNVDAQDLLTLGPGKANPSPSFLAGLQDPKGFFTTATPTAPTTFADQLEKYDALNTAAPGTLTDSGLGNYFKNASLGVAPADVVRTETPRPGVTIQWDKDGVPHITGKTDADVSFGAGVADIEDRMFLTDVLRHTGAATMAQFVGPTQANIAQDAAQLRVAPYTPAELTAQIEALARTSPEAARLVGAFDDYIAGMNAEQSALCPAATPSVPVPGGLGFGFGQHCPVEYAALQRPPAPYTRSDIVSIASLVGGIFGTGGGGQYTNAIWLQQLQEKFGVTAGRKMYDDLREKNDPEAPVTTTVRTPYGGSGGVNPGLPGVALPDLHPRATQLATGAIVNADGSLSAPPPGAAGNQGNASTTDPRPSPTAGRLGVNPALEAQQVTGWLQRAMSGEQVGMSNALLVDAKHSASGHPTVVFGPQTGYYAPQLLMEEELAGPHTAARGVSFAGTNFVVEIGRGVDYAWSATSPYTDITDTVVQPLCNLDGSAPTVNSTAYLNAAGRCTAMINYRHTETGLPNIAAQAAPTQVSFLVLRTDHGIVRLRTTVKGKPVSIALQRSTYLHEADSVLGFVHLNDPGFVHDAHSFMKAAAGIQYAFNFFYVDDKDIAYYSAAKLPLRAPGTDLDLPRWGAAAYDWRGFAPFAAHPHVVNPAQGYLANWNNKLATGFASSSQVWGDGAVYRSLTLSDRIKALLARGTKVTRAQLVGAMIDAGTVDLRGAYVLPYVLDVIGTPKDPQDAKAVALMRSWVAAGAHRVDRKRTGAYVDQAAIDVFDTWWDPTDTGASCAPTCGFSLPKDALRQGLVSYVDVLPEPMDDHPREHIGSAFNGISWYGYLNKDLRHTLGRAVLGPYSRSYCGTLADCRAALTSSLHAAVLAALATQQATSIGALTYDKTRDAIVSVAAGVVGVRAIDWQNRPTFQQVVQFWAHRP
jgi:acyl-homoserine lactone acylase PvdQ